MGWDEQWSDPETLGKWLKPDGRILALARRLREQGAKRAFDLGCGPGRHVVALAREGFDTYGCDFSAPAVAYCRRWLAQEGLQAHVVRSDMAELPFGETSFDLIVAYNVIYHTTYAGMRALVEELRRRLRPGGWMYATLKGTHEHVYGEGEEIEPNTFLRESKAVPVHFSKVEEIPDLFGGFQIVDQEVQDYVKQSTQRRHNILRVTLRKPHPDDGHLSAARPT